VRPLDWGLAALKLALAPILAVLLSLPTIESLASSFDIALHDWILTLIGIVLAGVYVVALKTHAVGIRADRAIASVRRRVALGCNHDYHATHDGGGLACLLTPQVLQAPRFPYRGQDEVLDALVTACADAQSSEPHRYWFVEGESGSGKTRTALLLVQKLVRNRGLSDLAGRCYLYDLSTSASLQHELIANVKKGRHENAVVIVDNFQRISSEALNTLTEHLVRNPTSIQEHLLVFLTRRADAWNLTLDHDVDLLTAAKRSDCFLSLAGPAEETVVRYVAEIDREAAALLRLLSDGGSASATQLHFGQVIVRNRMTPPELMAILRALTEPREVTAPDGLLRLLAIVVALSVHSGGFTRGELWRAVTSTSGDRSLSSSVVNRLHLYRRFVRVRKIGLVPRMHLGGARYVFHEAIAELVVDRLWQVAAFQDAFVKAGEVRLRCITTPEDALDAWLVAAEIGDQDRMQDLFDGAMARGGYWRMVRCLRRAETRYPLSSLTRLQLAILLHRTGELAQSREEFTDDLLDALGSSEDLAIMFVTSRMEATHDEAAEAALDVLCNQESRLATIIGSYWKVHMAAHHGQFDADALLEMADELRGMLNGEESYWSVYALARMHFDSLRHLYLEGRASRQQIKSPQREAIYDYVRDRLATAEPLHALYIKAHLVCHVLLPNRELYGEPIDEDDAVAADLTFEERRDPEGLIRAAQRLYRQAAEDFGQYGDREALYLRADILNADMIACADDLAGVERLLDDYSAFGDANFRSIASYPHLYRLRWHVLMHYEALKAGDWADADHHLSNARARLKPIIELDTVARNRYGCMRAELLGTLLDGIRQPLDFNRLAALESTMDGYGYGIEVRLIRHLREMRSREQIITQTDLLPVFRFYPFVHQ
jgi:hypothetical protein